MIVTVLGGSAAGPNTGAGSAGFLVRHGATAVVLDLGPDTILELRKHIDFRDLTAIVISHYHLDHILDLGALRYHLAYNPVPAHHRIALWVPPGSTERFARWAETFGHDPGIGFFADHFTFAEYDPALGLAFPGIAIAMAPTVHEAQGWAMRVSSGTGQSFGYTADTGPAADLAGHFQGVGLLISEATEATAVGTSDPVRGHLTATEAGALAAAAQASVLMLTHMWEEDDRDGAMAEAARSFGGPVILARPGTAVYP